MATLKIRHDGDWTNVQIVAYVNDLANQYNSGVQYAVGDYCAHEMHLYRCISSTTGSWKASAWEHVTVGEELKTKADKTDLAQKADKTDLTLKADKTEVSSALALKADKTEVNSALAQKADGTDVSRISGVVNDHETRIENLEREPSVPTDLVEKVNKLDEEALRGDVDLSKGEEIPRGGGGGSISDVQVNGTSVVEDGVANVPVATTSFEGVMRPSAYYGTAVIANTHGIIATSKADNSNIDSRSSLYKPIVPNNLDYAVKAAMCDGNGADWTDSEKASAQERIGIVTLTQEEYDLLTVKGENTIYIIVGDAS